MANVIPAIVDERIRHFIALKYSLRKIAHMCSVAVETVKRRRNGEIVKPDYHCSLVMKYLRKFKGEVRELFFKCGCNCAVMLRYLGDLIPELPYLPSIRMLQRFCAPFRAEFKADKKECTKRFESAPGDQMQIDFGQKKVMINGQEQVVHVFVAKMGYSRRIFCKAFTDETQQSWFDGIESAFRYFGGLPNRVVCDNAAPLVKQAGAPSKDRYTLGFEFFCRHYAVEPMATAPYHPQSKGKVESGVRYVKHNALTGPISFNDLDGLNEYLLQWCHESDKRVLTDILVTGLRTPERRWTAEQPELREITCPPFPIVKSRRCTVRKNGLIQFDKRLYRVDDSLRSKQVDVTEMNGTLIVTHSTMQISLNKAEDAITAEEQPASNPLSAHEKFDKHLNKLKESGERSEADPGLAKEQNQHQCLEQDQFNALFQVMNIDPSSASGAGAGPV